MSEAIIDNVLERPAKRTRLEPPQSPAGSVASDAVYDDTEDLYNLPPEDMVPVHTPSQDPGEALNEPNLNMPQSSVCPIPGLGLSLETPSKTSQLLSSEIEGKPGPSASEGDHSSTAPTASIDKTPAPGLQPADAIPDLHDIRLVSPSSQETLDPHSNTLHAQKVSAILAQPTPDPAFVQAALANKNNKEAEWQYDSSNMSSSSSSDSESSTSESDDSDEDDEYKFLDPEEQARILMSGDGVSDDEGGPKGSKSKATGPRTVHENPEEKVEKPDITVTDDMEILELGIAENIVESYLLIKGITSGETRVLEPGSVLVLQSRTVIGAVSELLGRVEEPRYSVAFSNEAEIADLGIQHGTKIYYVPQHSTYVFTQPLRQLKGSDASNQHDEEVDENELEFSDDEKEAEFKRLKKIERQAKRTGKADSAQRAVNAPQRAILETGLLPYDDNTQEEGEEVDDMYTPLTRPPKLDSLPPRPAIRNARGHADSARRGFRDQRGHGGSRRGRNERGGQGASNHHSANARTNARHEHQSHPQTTPEQHRSFPPPQQYQTWEQHGYPAPTLFPGSNPTAWHPGFGQHVYASAPPAPQNPMFGVPTGTHVNPAFFRTPHDGSPPAPSGENMFYHGSGGPVQGHAHSNTQQQYPHPAQAHYDGGASWQ